ncbi:hypothetical protein SGLAM104S_02504 [Streptomyces glaucescens]
MALNRPLAASMYATSPPLKSFLKVRPTSTYFFQSPSHSLATASRSVGSPACSK